VYVIASTAMIKNIAKYPTITGDMTIFPATATNTIINAKTTIGNPTRGERTKRSRLNLSKRFESAKRPMTAMKDTANCPERMVRLVPTTPYIARPITAKMIIDR